jgi:hypothetical protein
LIADIVAQTSLCGFRRGCGGCYLRPEAVVDDGHSSSGGHFDNNSGYIDVYR